jgi:hypothetical protein
MRKNLQARETKSGGVIRGERGGVTKGEREGDIKGKNWNLEWLRWG